MMKINYTKNIKFLTRFSFYLDENMVMLYGLNGREYDRTIRSIVYEFIDTRLQDVLEKIYPKFIVDNMLVDSEEKLIKIAYQKYDNIFIQLLA